MATIIFPCGRCGLKHEVDVSLAGKRLACAHCGSPILLPTPRTLPAPAAPSPRAPTPTPAQEPLSYKHACARCGKRHQVPETFFGKRTPCRRCGEPMDLPVPPGYVPRRSSALKTFDEPARAPTPEEQRTLAFILIDPPSPAARPEPPPPSLVLPKRAILLDDDDDTTFLLDDPPAPPPPPPPRPAPAMRFAPPTSRPPAPPAPREPTMEFETVDVFGLEDDAPPPPVWREPEPEVPTFVPRVAFDPPRKPRRSSGGGARTAGFLGGGLGGLGLLVVIIRVVLRLSLTVGPLSNAAQIERGERELNDNLRQVAALLAEVHDVESARQVDPKVAPLVRHCADILIEWQHQKISKHSKEYLEAKYDPETNELNQRIAREMRRIEGIPGAADALTQYDVEVDRLIKASNELNRLSADEEMRQRPGG